MIKNKPLFLLVISLFSACGPLVTPKRQRPSPAPAAPHQTAPETTTSTSTNQPPTGTTSTSTASTEGTGTPPSATTATAAVPEGLTAEEAAEEKKKKISHKILEIFQENVDDINNQSVNKFAQELSDISGKPEADVNAKLKALLELKKKHKKLYEEIDLSTGMTRYKYFTDVLAKAIDLINANPGLFETLKKFSGEDREDVQFKAFHIELSQLAAQGKIRILPPPLSVTKSPQKFPIKLGRESGTEQNKYSYNFEGMKYVEILDDKRIQELSKLTDVSGILLNPELKNFYDQDKHNYFKQAEAAKSAIINTIPEGAYKERIYEILLLPEDKRAEVLKPYNDTQKPILEPAVAAQKLNTAEQAFQDYLQN